MDRNEYGIPCITLWEPDVVTEFLEDHRMAWDDAVAVVQDTIDAVTVMQDQDVLSASCQRHKTRLRYDQKSLKRAWERILQG